MFAENLSFIASCPRRSQFALPEPIKRAILTSKSPGNLANVSWSGQGVKLNPEAAEVLFSTANVSYELKRYEEALDSYDRALAIRPDFAHALGNRGNVLFELKRYEEALDSYDQALAIQPDFAEAHHGRGNVLRTFGRMKEALPLLEKAVE